MNRQSLHFDSTWTGKSLIKPNYDCWNVFFLSYFTSILDRMVDAARQDGSYDEGVADVRGQNVLCLAKQPLFKVYIVSIINTFSISFLLNWYLEMWFWFSVAYVYYLCIALFSTGTAWRRCMFRSRSTAGYRLTAHNRYYMTAVHWKAIDPRMGSMYHDRCVAYLYIYVCDYVTYSVYYV